MYYRTNHLWSVYLLTDAGSSIFTLLMFGTLLLLSVLLVFRDSHERDDGYQTSPKGTSSARPESRKTFSLVWKSVRRGCSWNWLRPTGTQWGQTPFQRNTDPWTIRQRLRKLTNPNQVLFSPVAKHSASILHSEPSKLCQESAYVKPQAC